MVKQEINLQKELCVLQSSMLKMEHHFNKMIEKECVLKITTEPMIIPVQLQPEKRSRITVLNVCIPHRRQVAVAAASETDLHERLHTETKEIIYHVYNNNGPFQGQSFIHESISFKLSFSINV